MPQYFVYLERTSTAKTEDGRIMGLVPIFEMAVANQVAWNPCPVSSPVHTVTTSVHILIFFLLRQKRKNTLLQKKKKLTLAP